MSSSRRKTPRFRVVVQAAVIAVSAADQSLLSFTTENLSTQGLRIRSVGAPGLKSGDVLKTFLYTADDQSPEHTITFESEVVHVENEVVFGMKIVRIDSTNQTNLNKFINKVARDNPKAILI